MEFIDSQVAEETAASRAAAITQALRRERRRLAAEHDAVIYATTPDRDMDALATWASTHPIDLPDDF